MGCWKVGRIYGIVSAFLCILVFQFVILSSFEGGLSHHHLRLTPVLRNVESLPLSYSPRIATIVPYFGSSLPNWFSTFSKFAKTSENLMDWLIFIDSAPLLSVPDNVKLIRISKSDYCRRLAKLDQTIEDSARKDLEQEICRLITFHPYVMVEFKPALGFLFQDYLSNYSHWALADIDIIPGDFRRILSPHILSEMDVITFTFGDNFRLYMRGQMTIHKNEPRINTIWKRCLPLSQISSRLHDYAMSNYSHWHFQSAEGCYSHAMASEPNLTIWFSNSQFSDAYGAPLLEKESIFLGNSLIHCFQPLVTNSSSTILDSMDDSSSLSSSRWTRYHHQIDQYFPHILKNSTNDTSTWTEQSHKEHSYRCSYWIEDDYQVCLGAVSGASDLLRLPSSGRETLRYWSISPPHYSWLVPSCREGALAHFQGWKRHYYLSFTRSTLLEHHKFWILSDIGFLPLPFSRNVDSSLPKSRNDVSRKDVENSKINAKVAMFEDARTMKEEAAIPDHCMRYSKDLKKCQCPLYPSYLFLTSFSLQGDLIILETIQDGIAKPHEKQSEGLMESVTLVTVVSYPELFRDSFRAFLEEWTDPKLIVVAHWHSLKELKLIGSFSWSSSLSLKAPIHFLFVNISNCWMFSDAADDFDTPNHGNYRHGHWRPDFLLWNLALDYVATDVVNLRPFPFHFQLASPLRPPSSSFKREPQNLFTQAVKRSFFELEKKKQEAIAMLFPQYQTETFSTNLSSFEQQRANLSSMMTQFPIVPYRSSCGLEQSSSLLPEFNPLAVFQSSSSVISSSLSWISSMKFRASELLLENTDFQAVMYRMSSCPHGKNFFRFPEELHGRHCYGSSGIRGLVGSGYHLYWNAQFPLFSKNLTVASSSSSSSSIDHYCGCYPLDNDHDKNQYLEIFNRFYLRAVQLRRNGVEEIYSKEIFGKRFEEEQIEVLLQQFQDNEN